MSNPRQVVFIHHDGIDFNNGFENNKKFTLEKSKCLLPISVGKKPKDHSNPDNHNKKNLKIALEWVADNFNECNIIITDNLQRHLYYGQNANEITESVETVKQGWLSAIFEIYLSYLINHELSDLIDIFTRVAYQPLSFHIKNCKFHIDCWSQYTQQIYKEKYLTELKKVKDEFKTNPHYRHAVINTINKHFTKLHHQNKLCTNVKLASIEYVLEECAVYLLWENEKDLSYQYIIYYQGEVNDAIMYWRNQSKRFVIPKAYWNELSFFVQSASTDHYHQVFNMMNIMSSIDPMIQLKLLEYVHGLRHLASAKNADAAQVMRWNMLSGYYFLAKSTLQYRQDVRLPIFALVNMSYKTAKDLCEKMLIQKTKMSLPNIMIHFEEAGSVALDLLEIYASILFNYSAYYEYMYDRNFKSINYVYQEDIAATMLNAVKVNAYVRTKTAKNLWCIAGASYNYGCWLTKATEFTQSKKIFEELKSTDWMEPWYGKVKRLIGLATACRLIAQKNKCQNSVLLLEAQEYLHEALAITISSPKTADEEKHSGQEYREWYETVKLNIDLAKACRQQVEEAASIFGHSKITEALKYLTEAESLIMQRKHRITDEYCAKTNLQYGAIYLFQDKLVEAKRCFQQVIILYGEKNQSLNAEYLALLAKAYYLCAQVHLALGEYDAASTHCQKSERLNKKIYHNERYVKNIYQLKAKIIQKKKSNFSFPEEKKFDDKKSPASVLMNNSLFNNANKEINQSRKLIFLAKGYFCDLNFHDQVKSSSTIKRRNSY